MTTEGAKVRRAFDGPQLDHDELVGFIEARMREDHVDQTGVNTQALSWMKIILKKMPKKDGQQKAMDIIRSLKAGLPLIEAHVSGQGSGEMNLDPQEPETELESDQIPDNVVGFGEDQVSVAE